jgi:hypothetical protein
LCGDQHGTHRLDQGLAQALADDLECWLHAEPIQARRATQVERVWLWCRRKPVVAGMSAAVIALVFEGPTEVDKCVHVIRS